MPMCMPKINFIISFFLEILHFKESLSLIGQKHFGPNSKTRIARHEIDGEISITILVFILNNFQKKLMTKFSKNSNPILGPFWALFCQIWGKVNFYWKKAPSVFKYANHCAKKQKKPMTHFWERCWTRTGRQTTVIRPLFRTLLKQSRLTLTTAVTEWIPESLKWYISIFNPGFFQHCFPF